MKTLFGTFAALLFLAGSLSLAQSLPAQRDALTCKGPQSQNATSQLATKTSELTGVTDTFLISVLYFYDEINLANVFKTLSPEQLQKREQAVLKNSRKQFLENIFYETKAAHNQIGQQDCGMTDAEVYMIRLYTTAGYKKINEVLRSEDTALQQKYQPMLDTLNSGLAKIAAYQGEVLRGQTIHADVLDLYCIGCVITMKGYTSSSTTHAFGYPYTFKIISETGHYIGPVSAIPQEKEVLFAPRARFQIISKEGNVFTMKEVKPPL